MLRTASILVIFAKEKLEKRETGKLELWTVLKIASYTSFSLFPLQTKSPSPDIETHILFSW